MSIDKETKTKLMENFARHQGDTGSPEVQIAILSSRITQLTDHLRQRSWLPMAYSPRTRVAYVPAIELMARYSDAGIDAQSWKRWPGYALDGGVNLSLDTSATSGANGTSSLRAW